MVYAAVSIVLILAIVVSQLCVGRASRRLSEEERSRLPKPSRLRSGLISVMIGVLGLLILVPSICQNIHTNGLIAFAGVSLVAAFSFAILDDRAMAAANPPAAYRKTVRFTSVLAYGLLLVLAGVAFAEIMRLDKDIRRSQKNLESLRHEEQRLNNSRY